MADCVADQCAVSPVPVKLRVVPAALVSRLLLVTVFRSWRCGWPAIPACPCGLRVERTALASCGAAFAGVVNQLDAVVGLGDGAQVDHVGLHRTSDNALITAALPAALLSGYRERFWHLHHGEGVLRRIARRIGTRIPGDRCLAAAAPATRALTLRLQLFESWIDR